MSVRIAILSAIEWEVKPLVESWERRPFQIGTAKVPSFRREDTIVACVGMGPAAAQRGAKAVIASLQPQVVISTGFAGALQADLAVGDIVTPACVVEAATGRRYQAFRGHGTVVSSPRVAGAAEKRALARLYDAQAVDMEAAAVAKVAQEHGVRFMAVKAITDPLDFPMVDFSRFTDSSGKLRWGRLLPFATSRPALWPKLMRLAANSSRASLELCRALTHLIEEQGIVHHQEREAASPNSVNALEQRLH